MVPSFALAHCSDRNDVFQKISPPQVKGRRSGTRVQPVEKDSRGHIVVEGTMRCKSHPQVWALGDCACIPSPEGKSYPNLAQHALREAKTLASNIHAVLEGRPPAPFVYDTLGMMGSLGHSKAFGQLLRVRVRGVVAWFVRRTYYLLQMPGWGRRFR